MAGREILDLELVAPGGERLDRIAGLRREADREARAHAALERRARLRRLGRVVGFRRVRGRVRGRRVGRLGRRRVAGVVVVTAAADPDERDRGEQRGERERECLHPDPPLVSLTPTIRDPCRFGSARIAAVEVTKVEAGPVALDGIPRGVEGKRRLRLLRDGRRRRARRSARPRGRGRALLGRARPGRRASRRHGARARHRLLAHAQHRGDGRALRRARVGPEPRQGRDRASSGRRDGRVPPRRSAPRRDRGVPHGARRRGRVLDPAAPHPRAWRRAARDRERRPPPLPALLAPREGDAREARGLPPAAPRPPGRARARFARRAGARGRQARPSRRPSASRRLRAQRCSGSGSSSASSSCSRSSRSTATTGSSGCATR